MITREKIKIVQQLIELYKKGITPSDDNIPYICIDLQTLCIRKVLPSFDYKLDKIRYLFNLDLIKPKNVGLAWWDVGDFKSRIKALNKLLKHYQK